MHGARGSTVFPCPRPRRKVAGYNEIALPVSVVKEFTQLSAGVDAEIGDEFTRSPVTHRALPASACGLFQVQPPAHGAFVASKLQGSRQHAPARQRQGLCANLTWGVIIAAAHVARGNRRRGCAPRQFVQVCPRVERIMQNGVPERHVNGAGEPKILKATTGSIAGRACSSRAKESEERTDEQERRSAQR